ncbi:hypothetical protein F5B20DRAFT_523227 [Whalleya microplaca]|nr:hypothetical protein F5B20DRAFT_523227 [Whalleya microplaca]
MSSTSSNFDNARNDARSNFNETEITMTKGWMIGIILIVVALIVVICLAFVVYERDDKRRRERMAQLELKPNDEAYGYQGQQSGYTQTHEIANTDVGPRELSNNEIARESKPPSEQPRYEMSGKDARSELP